MGVPGRNAAQIAKKDLKAERLRKGVRKVMSRST